MSIVETRTTYQCDVCGTIASEENVLWCQIGARILHSIFIDFQQVYDVCSLECAKKAIEKWWQK